MSRLRVVLAAWALAGTVIVASTFVQPAHLDRTTESRITAACAQMVTTGWLDEWRCRDNARRYVRWSQTDRARALVLP